MESYVKADEKCVDEGKMCRRRNETNTSGNV